MVSENSSCPTFLNIILANPIKFIFPSYFKYKRASWQKEKWTQSQGHRLLGNFKQIICSIAPEFNGSDFPHLAITALALPALPFATTHTKFSSPWWCRSDWHQNPLPSGFLYWPLKSNHRNPYPLTADISKKRRGTNHTDIMAHFPIWRSSLWSNRWTEIPLIIDDGNYSGVPSPQNGTQERQWGPKWRHVPLESGKWLQEQGYLHKACQGEKEKLIQPDENPSGECDWVKYPEVKYINLPWRVRAR